MDSRIADAMAQDLRHCEAQDFITHYLPTPKEGLVDKVLDSLLAGGVKEPSRTNYTTERSSNCPPIQSPYTFGDLSENSSGAFISKVSESHFERIVGVGERIREVLVQEANLSKSGLSEPLESASCNPHPSQARLHSTPDRRFSFGTAVGDFKVNAFLLEGVLCPHDSGSKLPTHRILVPQFEIARKATKADVRQNRDKLFAAVNSIMNGDARRDFVYGITNEDDRVSLWYFSRTHSVKSSSFSFVKDPDQLVRVLVSLLSASEEDLGLNPNIALYPKKNAHPGFIYRFPGDSASSSRFFKTTGVVQEASSETLSCGTTRVWKAIEVANFEGKALADNLTPKEIIIKDVWIDGPADTEKQIQDKVFKSIDDFVGGPQPWRDHPCLAKFPPSRLDDLETLITNKKYQERFLRIRGRFEGPLSKSVAKDTWASPSIFTQAPVEAVSMSPLKTQRNRSKYQSTSASQVAPVPKSALQFKMSGEIHTEFAPKKRCFFYFDEVCTRVSHVPTFGDAVDILRQASAVLILMFCAGWIHRDISTGNVLAMKESDGKWLLKLADLEYAKEFPSPGQKARGDWKTGTPYFMATELQRGRYLQPQKTLELIEPDSETQTGAAAQLHDVVHNLQHDLESLWWIGFYIGAVKIGHQASELWCRKNAVFQPVIEKNPDAPRHQIMLEGFPEELDAALHPGLTEFMAHWKTLRNNMVVLYQQRSADKVTDKGTYAVIAWHFLKYLGFLEKSRNKWGPIQLVELPGSDESKKRGREEDGAGQAKGVKRGSNQQEDTDDGPSVKRPRVATPTPLQANEEGGDLFRIPKARPTRGGPSSTKSRRSGK
ncbi:hypothetical protein D9611_014507 [Ephemerocybe angulata]|uniref:Fungal-type protein kinase domain-containing protein n=1 Tax=Ephemerocybe angulata TaxID=980116 RepID=A0A8H5FEI5_9AGAR|nr:hypothetical protein D9611_014507 [Tulosesus angulatus]